MTICKRNRECLFGDIVGGRIQPNASGQMISRWWKELPNRFPSVEKDEFVIMPNHIHGIIKIVGADRCVCPKNNDKPEKGEHTGSPLHRMVQWFKTMTTNAYINGVNDHGWKRFNGKLWQRNYYEHIIRNEDKLNRIREYIVNNPFQWAEDEDNPVNFKRKQ